MARCARTCSTDLTDHLRARPRAADDADEDRIGRSPRPRVDVEVAGAVGDDGSCYGGGLGCIDEQDLRASQASSAVGARVDGASKRKLVVRWPFGSVTYGAGLSGAMERTGRNG